MHTFDDAPTTEAAEQPVSKCQECQEYKKKIAEQDATILRLQRQVQSLDEALQSQAFVQLMNQ